MHLNETSTDKQYYGIKVEYTIAVHNSWTKKLNNWKIDFSDFTIFDISFYFQQLFNYLPTAVGRKVDSCWPQG